MVLVAISIAMCFYRLVLGPSLPDRAVALDTIGINVVAMIGLFSIKTAGDFYTDAMLVIGILAFVGTVAISKFLVKGEIIDRDNN
jgi:multisubunit Na+/H+ antiporter MnhF subunit